MSHDNAFEAMLATALAIIPGEQSENFFGYPQIMWSMKAIAKNIAILLRIIIPMAYLYAR